MKQAFFKIISSTMALLLLLSTVSWTVDKHMCMGRVMDVAFFSNADDCGMKAAFDLLEEQGYENHCCDDESFTMQGQDDLSLSFDDISIEQQFVVYLITHSYLKIFEDTTSENFVNDTYPPPLLVYDIQLLDQVFLI